MIDLHLHTTASDGRFSPRDLVARVHAAGITVMSVTDHDTLAAIADVHRAATAHGIELVNGVEVTAAHDGRDVHILGYFVDPTSDTFTDFLTQQRARRVHRVREIGTRLARLGAPVNVEALLERSAHTAGTSIGRPVIARALVAAGYVASLQEAFDRFLAAGRPAFVPRTGESPAAVVDRIHAAGGIASMAHPGVTRQPALMASLASAGLDAIEVYHSDHTPEMQRELQMFAVEHDLLVTGGSDFHGDDDTRDRPLGRTTLPRAEFDRLREAAHHA